MDGFGNWLKLYFYVVILIVTTTTATTTTTTSTSADENFHNDKNCNDNNTCDNFEKGQLAAL